MIYLAASFTATVTQKTPLKYSVSSPVRIMAFFITGDFSLPRTGAFQLSGIGMRPNYQLEHLPQHLPLKMDIPSGRLRARATRGGQADCGLDTFRMVRGFG